MTTTDGAPPDAGRRDAGRRDAGRGDAGSAEAARAYADSIIDIIHQPLVVLDDRLHIVSANRSFYRAFALNAEATVGRPLAAAGGFSVPELRPFLDQIEAGRDCVEDYKLDLELPQLGRRSLRLSARTIRESPLSPRKTVVAVDDVTEREQVAQALRNAVQQAAQADLGKSRFLAAASHDLRQPLQTIGLLQGVLARTVKDEAVLKLVARLDETVNAMSGMLNALLDISQLEAGVVRHELLDFPINGILEHLGAEFGYHARVHGLGWTVVPSRLAVRSDPRLLEQMLRNLLSNAMQYTERGRILLGCRRRGDRLRIEVWDSGIGIPDGHLRAIFDEFHQIDNAAREGSRGLGLGLAIVKRLSELLDHPVDVRSRPGHGSVFAIEVPLARRSLERGSAPRQDERTDRDAQGHDAQGSAICGAILIVEDHPTTREMLDLLLIGEGYRTATAANGKEALGLVASGAIDPRLLIADYNLPGTQNGLQVAAELHTMLGREIAAIIVTGDISAGVAREVARQGCILRYKPVNPGELIQLIAGLMATVDAIAKPPAQPPSHPSPPQSTGGVPSAAVVVIDDDAGVREALRELLQLEGRKVETFASCEGFLESGIGRAGCLVLDARLPGMSGLDLLEHLKKSGEGPPVLMITAHGDVATAVRAMEAGAIGFIEKPVRPDILLASVERAFAQSRDSTAQAAQREAAAARIGRLTRRERQVMDLVILGNPNKEIAALLEINQRTVENHRASVMHKTGTRSLSELIHLEFAARPPAASAGHSG